MATFKKGMRVTVNGETAGEIVSRIAKGDDAGKFRVHTDAGETIIVKSDAMELRQRGRKSLLQTMSADDIAGERENLLTKLRNAPKGSGIKKQIRRKLRRLGVWGGVTNTHIIDA